MTYNQDNRYQGSDKSNTASQNQNIGERGQDNYKGASQDPFNQKSDQTNMNRDIGQDMDQKGWQNTSSSNKSDQDNQNYGSKDYNNSSNTNQNYGQKDYDINESRNKDDKEEKSKIGEFYDKVVDKAKNIL